LEARIRQARPEARTELVRSSGGVFEVSRNGELIFSKRETGLFPHWDDIESKL
jgi:predicted Rdx family selenoprotein